MKTLIFAALLLAGCGAMPGVTASPEEQAACKTQTCSVWTPDEIKRLALEFYSQGYKAATKRGAKSL